MTFYTMTEFQEAADAIRERTAYQPTVGIILGSGLGPFAETVQNADVIPVDTIPHWPLSTVKGHAGRLYIGELEGHTVIVLKGRAHFYEGYPPSQITLPIRVMTLLGVKTLILTNAAGGLNQSFSPADLMLLTDHVNWVGMAGGNPLIGPNNEQFGTRFPDMTTVYDKELRDIAIDVADKADIPLQRGIYCWLSGPSFETPAECRMLRMLGIDAVGMSTVPEAIIARHGGLRVMAVSGIANLVIDDPDSLLETTHDEVLEAGKLIVPRLETLLTGVLKRLSSA